MKGIGASLKTHLAGGVLTLATIWTITRRDGAAFRFTDHPRPLTVGGHVYSPKAGYDRTSVRSTGDLSVDNLDVTGVFDSDSLSERDLRGGLFDFAQVEIGIVNWKDPDQGTLALRTGWLGEVTLKAGVFTAELRGMMQPLHEVVVGHSYTPSCRAVFCDARCGLNRAGFTAAGTVGPSPAQAEFPADGVVAPAGHFSGGAVRWLTGQNAGATMEVREWVSETATVRLFAPMPYPVEPGDSFEITRGCNKLFSTCVGYGNAVNFRGEPHVPGDDYMRRGPA